MRKFGSKNTIMIGLIFEMLQLICYGLGSQLWFVVAHFGFKLILVFLI